MKLRLLAVPVVLVFDREHGVDMGGLESIRLIERETEREREKKKV